MWIDKVSIDGVLFALNLVRQYIKPKFANEVGSVIKEVRHIDIFDRKEVLDAFREVNKHEKYIKYANEYEEHCKWLRNFAYERF